MATEKIIIAELGIDTDALIKNATNTRKALDSLKKSNNALKKAEGDNTKEIVKNEIAINSLSTSYRNQKKVLTALTDENKSFVKTEVAINKALQKNINTEEEATANNKKLLTLRKSLNKNTAEGAKQISNINSKIDKNNKFLKDNASEQGKAKIGIGGYEAALSKFFPKLAGVTNGLKAQKASLIAQRSAMQSSTAATSTGSKALKIFRLALISTGIGAIVVAIGSLIAAFSSTQKGADAISKAIAPIKGAFQGIIGVVQDIAVNVFGQLGDRFTIVKNGLLLGIDLIRLAWNKLTGDVEEATEIQEKMKERIEEVRQAQLRLNKKTEEFKNILKGAGAQILAAAKAQIEIERLTISIEKREAAILLIRAKSRVELRKLQLIANDRSRSAQENNDAANEAIKIAKGLAEEEKGLINLKIQQEELRQSQNDSDRKDLKTLNELKASAIQADETAAATELKFLTAKTNLLKQQQAAAKKASIENTKRIEDDAKKQLDISIRLAEDELALFIDKNKSILDNEKFLTDQSVEEEKRRLLLISEEQKAFQQKKLDKGVIDEIEFNRQINEINKLNSQANIQLENDRKLALETQRAIDAQNQIAIEEENFNTKFQTQSNRLEASRQQELAAAKKTGADLDVINTKFDLRKRKLDQATALANAQIRANTLGQIAEGLGKESALGKLAALAQAGINVQVGVTKAIAQGGLLGIVTGAIVAAKGAQVISKIAGFDEGGKVRNLDNGSGGRVNGAANMPTRQGGDNILATVKTGEVILNDSQQQRAGGSAFFKSIGVPGFQTGGIVGGLTSNVTAPISNGANPAQETARILAAEINKIKVVAIVDDITSGIALQAEIIDGSNI